MAESSADEATAELARLYDACPTAAIISLDEAIDSPDKVDALLPGFRKTVARDTSERLSAPKGAVRVVLAPGHRAAEAGSEAKMGRSTALPPAVPRIRYPVALGTGGPPSQRGSNEPASAAAKTRIALAPRVASSINAGDEQWLIDPNEWYTPQEQAAQSAEAPGNSPTGTETPLTNGRGDGSGAGATAGPAKLAPGAETSDAAAPGIEPAQNAIESEYVESESGPAFGFDSALNDESEEPLESSELEPAPRGDAGEEAGYSEAPSTPWQAPSDDVPEHAPFAGTRQPNAGSARAVDPAHPATETLPSPVPAARSEIFAPPANREMIPRNDVVEPPLGAGHGSGDASGPTRSGGRFDPDHPSNEGSNDAGADENCDVDPHLELFAKNNYPSARECATCHEEIYEQWSVSAHAYAAVSPMYNKFEQKLNDLSQGTVGYFCMRCHAPVATAMCASRAEPLWNLPEVAREGITCIACHRVNYVYGKSNGERRIEPGNVFAPVNGGIGGAGVAEAIHRKDEFKVKTSPDEKGPGQDIHVAGIYFDPLTRSEACTPCHQVAVHPGIKLEVVWEQYRASPACKKGIQCQDCHMGRVPGLPLGYDIGAVAKVNGKTVNDHRKKSNHMFHGPNYSIAHPGVFPFHLKANRWTMQEWLTFDWRAGWGTDEFEDRVADGEIAVEFPPCWAEVDDRYDARDILDDNLKKLELKRENRRQVMENGSKVEGPFFDSPVCCGEDIRFHYLVTNTNEGHNLLTASLGAQPQLWANIVLIGPDGRRLWETGYTDSYGDLANIHSEDVRHGRLPFDWQLFNLQTMFLITGAKGTDREFFVPVNLDIDQLPFIRPGAQPISVINHPPFIRMESQSLAPLGVRKVPYRIPGELIRQPGKYRLLFRMRSRAEPMYFMRFCESTPEMQRMMNQWMIDVHPISVEFDVR